MSLFGDVFRGVADVATGGLYEVGSAAVNAIKPGSPPPNTADEQAAQVAQAQYDDWKNTYLPIARDLTQQTTLNNPGLVNQGITQAVGDVNSAFNTQSGVQQRYAQEYGIIPDAMQGAVNSRVNSVGRSQSVVDAANRIRANLANRDTSIMQTGVPTASATGL